MKSKKPRSPASDAGGVKSARNPGAAHPSPSRHPFLVSTARTLREACCEAGLDRNGRRCADCPVRDLCADESRWVIQSARGTA